MEYAVVLYFDQHTQARLTQIMQEIVSEGANDYMLAHKIPPHITLSTFRCTRRAPMQAMVERCAHELTSGTVAWISLGAFVPSVLFASPVQNEYLLDACKSVNDRLASMADVQGYGYSVPYRWVPHTSLAVRLTHEELCGGFATAARHFSPLVGTADRLALVACNPYKEIKAWPLADDLDAGEAVMVE